MNQKSIAPVLFLLCAFLLHNVVITGQSGSPEQQVDQIFAAWNNPGIPGASIAVVKDGKIIFKKGYGSANLEYSISNSPSTVFHIASVSKQVTAFAVLLLESQGKLSLNDDIRKYIPEMPDYGKPITLRQLMTHTSGLRDQWELLSMAGWRLDDIITTEHILRLACRQKELNFNPGDAYMYSNTGYTLLAEVVYRVSGQSFVSFTSNQIFKPLNMTSTLFYDDHEKIVKNRAYSYYPQENEYKKSVLNYANAGATSLFTTVEDMGLWVMNFENPVVGNKVVIQKMKEQGILNNGDTISYALGQDIGQYKGLTFISHGGADAGYRSFLGRFPDQHFSVIVFSNNASFDPGGTALKVADIYLKDEFVPEKPQETPPVQAVKNEFAGDPEMLKTYCGKFELRPGYVIHISSETDKLFAETREIPKIQLVQLDKADFSVPQLNARLTFSGDNNGTINEIIIVMNGQQMIAPKMKEFDATTINPDDFSGDFFSPELSTTYTFVTDKGQLVARHPRLGDFVLTATDRDKFSTMKWFLNKIEFTRDENNLVTGCKVSSFRVRNIAFERIN